MPACASIRAVIRRAGTEVPRHPGRTGPWCGSRRQSGAKGGTHRSSLRKRHSDCRQGFGLIRMCQSSRPPRCGRVELLVMRSGHQVGGSLPPRRTWIADCTGHPRRATPLPFQDVKANARTPNCQITGLSPSREGPTVLLFSVRTSNAAVAPSGGIFAESERGCAIRCGFSPCSGATRGRTRERLRGNQRLCGRAQANSITASTSTGAPSGRAMLPTAARAC